MTAVCCTVWNIFHLLVRTDVHKKNPLKWIFLSPMSLNKQLLPVREVKQWKLHCHIFNKMKRMDRHICYTDCLIMTLSISALWISFNAADYINTICSCILRPHLLQLHECMATQITWFNFICNTVITLMMDGIKYRNTDCMSKDTFVLQSFAVSLWLTHRIITMMGHN